MRHAIEAHVRRICFGRILLPVLCQAGIFFLLYIIPFSSVFSPAVIEQFSSLDSMYREKERYVTISCDTLNYTGYDDYKNGTKIGSYYYVFCDGECYFVLIQTTIRNLFGYAVSAPVTLDPVLTDYTVTGRICLSSGIPRELFTSLAQDLDWTAQGVLDSCHAYYLNECAYHLEFYLWCQRVLYLLLGILAFFCLLQILYMVNPCFYPGCIGLVRFGSVRNQLRRVNEEISEPASVKIGRVVLTRNFFIEFGTAKLWIIPLKRIVWAYKLGTLRKLVFLRLPVSYQIHLYRREGRVIETGKMSGDDSTAILQQLKDLHPDIMVGYSEANRRLARKIKAEKKRRRKNQRKIK